MDQAAYVADSKFIDFSLRAEVNRTKMTPQYIDSFKLHVEMPALSAAAAADGQAQPELFTFQAHPKGSGKPEHSHSLLFGTQTVLYFQLEAAALPNVQYE